MKKTTYTTTRFDIDDDFYVEVSRIGTMTEFVLCNAEYGIKSNMFSLYEAQENTWEKLIMKDIESYIGMFLEEVSWIEKGINIRTTRFDIVMKALQVDESDAEIIIDHLAKYNCLEWIDNYKEENRSNEPLVDVHWEDSFKDMFDWKFKGYKPSEILGKSSCIEDYPEMLELADGTIIFWYELV